MLQGQPDEELVLELDDSFHRLQAHGLAEFHGLLSHSEGNVNDPHKRITVVQWPRVAHPVPKEATSVVGSIHEITCADILMALEDRPAGGINPAVLRRYLAGHSTESDVASEDYVML